MSNRKFIVSGESESEFRSVFCSTLTLLKLYRQLENATSHSVLLNQSQHASANWHASSGFSNFSKVTLIWQRKEVKTAKSVLLIQELVTIYRFIQSFIITLVHSFIYLFGHLFIRLLLPLFLSLIITACTNMFLVNQGSLSQSRRMHRLQW